MIQNALSTIKDNYSYISNHGISLVFAFFAWIYLYVKKEKTNVENKLCWIAGILLLVLLFPLSGYVIAKIVTGVNGYYLIMIGIPTIIIAAYVYTQVYFEQKTKFNKIVMAIALIVLLCANVFTNASFSYLSLHNNQISYAKEVEDLCGYIDNNYGSIQILATESFSTRAKEYSNDIFFPSEPGSVLYQRGAYNIDLFSQKQRDLSMLASAEDYASFAMKHQIAYVVLDSSMQAASYMESLGFDKVYATTHFEMYKFNGWSITDYPSATGNQSMFYSLSDGNGNLILIDGGWNDDVETVKSVIAENNNHVNAWILTHPDADHISAFNELVKSGCEDITIDNIYVPDVDYEEYSKNAKEYDGLSSYKEWIDLTRSWNNIIELKAGDEFEVSNLHFKCFNSYSNKIEGTDAINDGSLMIKMSGDKQSMLFTADIGSAMSDKLISQWGEELCSDYLQMAHHGNGGLSDEFYQIVNPSVAFFDAPSWLMHPSEDDWYDTDENYELMSNMGCTIYSTEDGSNTVLFK